MSEKDQFLEEEQVCHTPVGQNQSDTIQYLFSLGSTFFFSYSKNLDSENYFTQQPTLMGRILGY